MLLNILLSILVIDAIALTGVILLQRSEGGALGMGGGGGAFLSARGAGDLLTRTTAVLATLMFLISIAITLITGHTANSGSVADRVNNLNLPAASAQQPQQQAPASDAGAVAPPLPGTTPAAPPLPTEAPRPTVSAPVRPAPRQTGPVRIPTIAAPTQTTVQPRSAPLPKLDLSSAPASSTPQQ